MSVKEIGRPPGRPLPVEVKPTKAPEPAPKAGGELPEGGELELLADPLLGLPRDDGFRGQKVAPKSAQPIEVPGSRMEAPVEQLLPEDFEKVADLAHKFGGDVVLLRRELEGKPGKTPTEKLERLMKFFAAFAEEVVVRREQLYGDGPAKPGEGPKNDFFASDVKKFLETLKSQGLQHAKDPTDGRSGLEVARELLEQPTLQQFHEKAGKVQLTAQTWPLSGGKQEVDHLGRPVMTQSEIPIPQTALLQKASEDRQPFDQRVDGERMVVKGEAMKVQTWAQEAGKVVLLPRDLKAEEEARRDRSTNKVLGSNMLWNVLHKMREDEDSPEAQEKKALEQIAFGAIMLLVAAAIVVVIVVSL